MKLDDIDLTKKENQTFKNWFRIMWSNSYIFLFALGLGFIITICLSTFDTTSDFLLMLSIPVTSCVVIAYKGFFQYWRDLCKGNHR